MSGADQITEGNEENEAPRLTAMDQSDLFVSFVCFCEISIR